MTVTSNRVINVDPTRPVINYPSGSSPVARGTVTGAPLVSYGTLLLAQAPILYWPLDMVSVGAGQVTQLGSLGVGVYNGGIQTVGVTTRVAGPQNGGFACRFDGSTASFIDIDSGAGAGSALPSSSQVGTLILWFKCNAQGGMPFAFADTSALGQFSYSAGGAGPAVTQMILRRSGGAANQVSVTSTPTLTDAAWHMIALTSDNSATNIIYHDGVAVATSVATAGTATASDWLGDIAASLFFTTIGARRIVLNAGSVPFKGDIAQVSIHDSVLTPATIAALYAATLP